MAQFKRVLVFELSEGTFEVSILSIEDGIIEVLATNDDTHLTGKQITQRVMGHFIKLYKEKTRKDIHKDHHTVQKLRREVEKAKEVLCEELEAQIHVFESVLADEDCLETLGRAKFEELNMDLFRKMVTLVKKVLKKASLEKEDIHDIVLVGGSTRIPKVQQFLKEFFNGKEPSSGINRDEIAAYRAAINEKKEKSLSKDILLFASGMAYSASSIAISVATGVFERESIGSYSFLGAGAFFSIISFVFLCLYIRVK